MIDRELLDEYDAVTRTRLKEAMTLLASTGILTRQRERLFVRVAEGSATEDPAKVAEKVLLYRAQAHALVGMQQLGESLLREQDDE